MRLSWTFLVKGIIILLGLEILRIFKVGPEKGFSKDALWIKITNYKLELLQHKHKQVIQMKEP